MSIKRPQFVNNEIYHVVVRSVDESLIFKDESDYYRGIFCIYEFNTTEPIEIWKQRKKRKTIKAGKKAYIDTRNPFVEILTFCFMPNHIHLLLRQIKKNGITDFMRKVGTGYSHYFNKKYSRKGHLFQGRFNAVHIQDNEQLKNTFVYIHVNPVSLVEPSWKEKGVKDPSKVVKFLESYKWSSFLDYIGTANFKSVTNRDFILQVMGGEEGCRESITAWLKYKGELAQIIPFELE